MPWDTVNRSREIERTAQDGTTAQATLSIVYSVIDTVDSSAVPLNRATPEDLAWLGVA